MKIRNPNDKDIVTLKEIWQNIFGDTKDYIDLFFKEKVSYKDTFLIETKGKICAVLYSFPTTIIAGEQVFKAQYFCGIATLQKERGKGYSSKLIEAALLEMKNRNLDLCFLIPANPGLFAFYQRFSMEPLTGLSKQRITEPSLKPLPLYREEFDYEALDQFYRKNKQVFARRSYEEFRVIYECYQKLMLFDDGYLFYDDSGEELQILEHSYSGEKINSLCASMLTLFNKRSGVIASPIWEAGEQSFFTAGVFLKEIDPNILKNGYINLMLN